MPQRALFYTGLVCLVSITAVCLDGRKWDMMDFIFHPESTISVSASRIKVVLTLLH